MGTNQAVTNDRAHVLREIEWLMSARLDYSNETDDKVAEHMAVVKHLLGVLRGEAYAAEGWLPSWRWHEWEAMTKQGAGDD